MTTLREYLANPPASYVEICGCGCGKPLEKNDPLGPRWVGTGDNRKLINEDCYFEKMSDEIDNHPICSPGIRRPLTGGANDTETTENPETKKLYDTFSCVWRGPGGSGIAD